MGQDHSILREHHIDSIVKRIADSAASSCRVQIQSTVEALIHLLEEFHADKELITKVAQQQQQLLTQKGLDITGMLQPIEARELKTVQTEIWGIPAITLTIVMGLVIIVLLAVIVFLHARQSRDKSCILRPGKSCLKPASVQIEPTVRFEIPRQKAISLQSIYPID